MITDGDNNFVGVDMTTARDSLRPGFVADAENCRFRTGKIETRKGVSYNRAYCSKGAEFSWEWPVDFNEFARFPAIGIGEFMDPNGDDAVILLGTNHGFILFEDREPLKITYDMGVVLSGRIRCIQAFDAVFIFAKGHTPMRWSGDLDDRVFRPITKEPDAEGISYLDIPGAAIGLHFGNRLWIPRTQDTIQVSDISEYNRFVVANEILFNKGENDEIVALHPFNKTTLLVFKTDSIYALGGIYGTLSNIRVDILTSSIGCVSQNSVVTLGSDILWMAETGVYRLGQVDAERNVVNGEPVSKPIQPLIDRINWEHKDQIVSIVHDNRVYWAVPLDDSATCNAVLVFDTLLGQWQGVDTFATAMGFSIHSWLRAEYLGRTRLFAYGNDGYAYAYEEGNIGIDDAKVTGLHAIKTRVKTREYSAGGFQRKNWTNMRAELSTYNPSINVVAETTGTNETVDLFTDYTRNRLKSTNFGGIVDEQNVDGSWANPFREDYYVPSRTTAINVNVSLDSSLYINTLTIPTALTGYLPNEQFTITASEWGLYAEVTADANGTIAANTVVTIDHKGATGAEGATTNSTGAPNINIYKIDVSPTPSSISVNLSRCYYLKTGITLGQLQNYTYPAHLRQSDKAVGFEFTNNQGVMHLRGLVAVGMNAENLRSNE
mgnify:CR=1 FL=1|tara:strand:- start:2952 stop:4937 length:1986 start_codon:yes stop_codon:yes gene_type:complete